MIIERQWNEFHTDHTRNFKKQEAEEPEPSPAILRTGGQYWDIGFNGDWGRAQAMKIAAEPKTHISELAKNIRARRLMLKICPDHTWCRKNKF